MPRVAANKNKIEYVLHRLDRAFQDLGEGTGIQQERASHIDPGVELACLSDDILNLGRVVAIRGPVTAVDELPARRHVASLTVPVCESGLVRKLPTALT